MATIIAVLTFPVLLSLRSQNGNYFIERVQDVYSDLLPSNCTIFLQVKDEEWEGVFVDYFEGTVPEKSIYRIVTAKPVEVKIQCIDKSLAPVASSHFANGIVT